MNGEHEQIAAQYLSSGKTNMQIKALFHATRMEILKRGEYEDPEGRLAIIRLAEDPETSDVDRQRLLDLSTRSMRQINFAIANRICYLEDRDVTMPKLRKIKIVRHPFQDFVLPRNMWAKVASENRQRILDRNCHIKNTRDEVNTISIQEAEEMRQRAIEYLQANTIPATRKIHAFKLLDVLSILTGRRQKELYETLEVKCVPDNDYQANVRGLCKIYPHQAAIWQPIPLLAPYPLIVRGICALRGIRGCKSLKSGRFFVKPFTHTTFRNLYSEMAYRERHSHNKFMIGNDTCGSLVWRGLALGVSLSDVANHYSIMCVEEQESDDPTSEPE
jgi:hypothetical protein